MTTEKPEKKIPCEVYSRIVGYLRPISQWNAGKQQEFAERTDYVIGAGEKETENDLSRTD